MITVHNTSPTRTILHAAGNDTIRIDPLALKELPESVANEILSGWECAKADMTEDIPNMPKTPWEFSAGPAWEETQKLHKIGKYAAVNQPQPATVGADRPPLQEPAVPADAYDKDTGKVIESKLNTHVCNMCEKPYKQLGALRNHQAKEHNA